MKLWTKSRIAPCILCTFTLVTAAACTPINANNNSVQNTSQTDVHTTPESEPFSEMEEPEMVEKNRKAYEKSMEELRKQYEQNPNDKTIALDYAEILFQLGNFPQSQEILKPLLADEKTFPGAIHLSAQIEYVNGNYSEAERLYEILANQFPEFKEKAEYGLEYVYYQTNQYFKVQNLSIASDCTSGIGAMMRAFGHKKPYQIDWFESETAIIPFLKTDPLPLIQAEIEGQMHNFIVDTGAGETYLDDKLATSLGIETIAEDKGVYAGGVSAITDYGILESITLNGVKISSVPVNLMSMDSFSSVYDNEFKISGIIGIGIFKQLLATMDYPEGQLILSPRDGQSGNSPNNREAQNKNAIELPFILASTHLMISKSEINGKEVNVFLDSGLAADEAILLPKDTMHYTNIPIPATENVTSVGGGGVGEIPTGHFNVDSFRLGAGTEAKNISGLYGVFPESYYFDENIGFFIDALVSHNFLKDYQWTIDFDSMMMTFKQ